jgi:hypothetical protein
MLKVLALSGLIAVAAALPAFAAKEHRRSARAWRPGRSRVN